MSTSGELSLLIPLHADLSEKHVLIIEDIVDTGLTLNIFKIIFSPLSPKMCEL